MKPWISYLILCAFALGLSHLMPIEQRYDFIHMCLMAYILYELLKLNDKIK